MLDDAPENDTPLAAAIWQIHQRRIVAALETARAGRPVLDVAARDPWALRGLLLLLLLVGIVIAGPAAPLRIAGALVLPPWPFAGASVNAWITPPAYSGTPPQVLADGDVTALAGSSITVIVDRENDEPVARLGSAPLVFEDLTSSSHRADAVLQASAKLQIGPWWHRLAAWNIKVVPPTAPAVTLINQFVAGQQLVMAWQATDAYGVASLSARLTPVGYSQAAPGILPLAFEAGNPRAASGVAKPDVGWSPYAGLQVELVLKASNLAGVTSATAPVTITLPPPELHDKTALALADLRQRLALEPKDKLAAGAALNRLAQAPLSHIDAGADVNMAVLATALSQNQVSAEAAENQLAQLSQQVEAGPDYEPAKALAAANRALEQALQQALNGGKLDAGHLQALLDAMHSALAQHLQALGPSAAPGGSEISPGDLDRMAQQIAQDEAAGNTAKAAAELQQLEQTLAALQSARPMSAAQAAQSAAANQAAQALSQLTQGEAALLDQTNQGAATPADQGTLLNQLLATRHGLDQAGIKLPGLGDAAAAMRAAQSALGQTDITASTDAEGAAIQALQKAAATLAASGKGMAFGEGGQPGGGKSGFDEGINGGPDEDDMPQGMPSSGNAAREIEQQIIKRDADPALPDATRQYYDRLLDQDSP
jgi:hypothetical protein